MCTPGKTGKTLMSNRVFVPMVAPGEQLSRLLRARFECEKGHIAEPYRLPL